MKLEGRSTDQTVPPWQSLFNSQALSSMLSKGDDYKISNKEKVKGKPRLDGNENGPKHSRHSILMLILQG
jgi:hypothetical protein